MIDSPQRGSLDWFMQPLRLTTRINDLGKFLIHGHN